MSGSVTLDLKGLQAFKRQLRTAVRSSVEVGIFEENTTRADPNQLTNAEIGYRHEFGLGVPVRSWLNMPLVTELPDVIKSESSELSKAFVDDGAKAMLERVGFMGEAVIQDAFDTQGFGTWPDNSEMTIAMKGRNEPLVDTTQLKKSVSSRVK